MSLSGILVNIVLALVSLLLWKVFADFRYSYLFFVFMMTNLIEAVVNAVPFRKNDGAIFFAELNGRGSRCSDI